MRLLNNVNELITGFGAKKEQIGEIPRLRLTASTTLGLCRSECTCSYIDDLDSEGAQGIVVDAATGVLTICVKL